MLLSLRAPSLPFPLYLRSESWSLVEPPLQSHLWNDVFVQMVTCLPCLWWINFHPHSPSLFLPNNHHPKSKVGHTTLFHHRSQPFNWAFWSHFHRLNSLARIRETLQYSKWHTLFIRNSEINDQLSSFLVRSEYRPYSITQIPESETGSQIWPELHQGDHVISLQEDSGWIVQVAKFQDEYFNWQ